MLWQDEDQAPLVDNEETAIEMEMLGKTPDWCVLARAFNQRLNSLSDCRMHDKEEVCRAWSALMHMLIHAHRSTG